MAEGWFTHTIHDSRAEAMAEAKQTRKDGYSKVRIVKDRGREKYRVQIYSRA